VQIVESLAPLWVDGEAWSVASEPDLEIGLMEGPSEFLFQFIRGAILLPDDRIAVADLGSSEVRFFDRSGDFLSLVGGPGDGPGELGRIRGLGLCGADSLFVFEGDYQTVVFSPSGSYVRAARPYSERQGRPYQADCAPNGNYVAVGWPERAPCMNGFYRAEAPAWTLARMARSRRDPSCSPTQGFT
jgi:hypothetical protein